MSLARILWASGVTATLVFRAFTITNHPLGASAVQLSQLYNEATAWAVIIIALTLVWRK